MSKNSTLNSSQLSIGDVAHRTGLSVSAIRFYEERGLIVVGRNKGGQRRFARADIRRLSFIMIAQQMGFSLERIGEAISEIPKHKAPSKAQWSKLAKTFRTDLDERIDTLSRLRDKLDGCIGCGCLSLDVCALYNAQDKAASKGAGPRYVIEG